MTRTGEVVSLGFVIRWRKFDLVTLPQRMGVAKVAYVYCGLVETMVASQEEAHRADSVCRDGYCVETIVGLWRRLVRTTGRWM